MRNSRLIFPLLAGAICAATLVLTPGSVAACSFAPLEMHELDPAEEQADTNPPEAPEMAELVFVRRPFRSAGCGATITSCDGSGQIGIELLPTVDDRSSPAEVGYIIEHAGGTLPDNLGLPPDPVRTDGTGTIWLLFSDVDQPLDFQLSIRAVDLGGNVSAAITIDVASVDSAGCSITSWRTQHSSWLLLLLAVILASRGRRRIAR